VLGPRYGSGFFDKVFVGAESDVLHTEIVYTIVVWKRFLFR
jgi:hypothetical protein